ncbi:hypothetical protein TNCV_2876111 [Trichonephila clavipes]|nr:hypothetical protein TNCV_2876111 [Trichonephila clavipes]
MGLNSRRAASPLVRLVEGEEMWEAPDYPQGILSQNWGETERNRSVTWKECSKLGRGRYHTDKEEGRGSVTIESLSTAVQDEELSEDEEEVLDS